MILGIVTNVDGRSFLFHGTGSRIIMCVLQEYLLLRETYLLGMLLLRQDPTLSNTFSKFSFG